MGKTKDAPAKTGRGGARPGAGRPKTKESPRTATFPFRVSESAVRRIKALQEMTRDDTMPFMDMLEAWVADMAQDYGIE